MGCDYFSQSKLIIEYRDEQDVCHTKTIYTSDLEKHYMGSYDYDSDDDYATKSTKYDLALEQAIREHNYEKILYMDEEWLKTSYKTNYENMCSHMVKMGTMIKLYKKYSAWERA
jgi:hypothetical protein